MSDAQPLPDHQTIAIEGQRVAQLMISPTSGGRWLCLLYTAATGVGSVCCAGHDILSPSSFGWLLCAASFVINYFIHSMGRIAAVG